MSFKEGLNTVLAALEPKKFPVIAKKIYRRLLGRDRNVAAAVLQSWLNENSTPLETWAQNVDADLWGEATEFGDQLMRDAGEKLRTLGVKLGGGGCYPLLYFLVRHYRPVTVVETGVAAGYSSTAVLAALQKNDMGGALYSSDFPYFRLPNPERFIGIIVPDALRTHWNLFIDGDEANLPKIMKSIEKVDLFHYDSDKSYEGREFALELVSKKLSKNAIVVIDDIQDNTHFMNLVNDQALTGWKIFEFHGKFVGLIGDF